MDTTRFPDDLTAIPASYRALAGALDQIDDLASALGASRPARVLILGMGSSRYAADRVARAARATGQAVVAEWASAVQLPPPSDDLVVVAVSATGRSAEVLAAVEPYAGRGRLIAVTNAVASPLAERADAVIDLRAGVESSGVASRTYRHTIVVLEHLLRLADRHRSRDELDRAAAATETLQATVSDWRPALAQVLDSGDGVHVLAPAERFCSAQQAALMVRELPRRLAVACETGDWAHVDVYTSRTHDYRAAVLTGSAWDAQAVEWLRSRGARFAAIGGELPGAEFALRFPDDHDDRVRVLVETLPFELVAAEWLAQDPEFGFSRRPLDRGGAGG